ncbi:MAG: hypothetical protein LBD91_03160 [Prevotellaceae bacterium]|jgi:hypothetical protein|nr:hypothetical protein [Prevotellaceae bacterium]
MRTQEEILRALREAFVLHPTLAEAYGLDTSRPFDEQFSRVSVEAADTYVVAAALAEAERIQADDIAIIQSVVERNRIGSGPWYVEMAKRFQWSEEVPYFLQVDDTTGVIDYNILNPDDRIITQAAFIDNNNEVTLKVATGTPGALHKLGDDPFSDFRNYMQRLKIAGIALRIITLEADIVNLQTDVYYSRAYNITGLRQAVVDALNAYSATLEFAGVVLRNAIIDVIQRVPGVMDVDVKALEANTGANIVSIGRAYTTAAGYFNFNQTDGWPQINLIAE